MNILHVGWFDPASAAWNMSCATNQYTGHTSKTAMRDFNHVSTQADITWSIPENRPFPGMDVLVEEVKWADVIVFHAGAWDEDYQFGAVRDTAVVSDIQHIASLRVVLDAHPEKCVFWLNGSRSLRVDVEGYKKAFGGARICATNQDIAELYDAEWVPCCIAPKLDAGAYLWHPFAGTVPRLAHPITDVQIKNVPEAQWACGTAGWRYHQISSVPWEENIKMRLECHALFDHMQGYFGVSSIEALAMGMPNIVGLPMKYREGLYAWTGSADPVQWRFARDKYDLAAVLKQIHGDVFSKECTRLWYDKHFTNAMKAKRFTDWLEAA